MTGRWIVIVDVAPVAVRDAADRVLRDFGFVEIMPCVYRSAWGDPAAHELRVALRRVKRRGIGRIGLARIRANAYTEL